MWNTIVSLFKKRDTIDHILCPKDWKETVLTPSSPRLKTPKKCHKTLWNHQQAMLARCKFIEENPVTTTCRIRFTERYQYKEYIPKDPILTSIGIMTDPPGSGKTYVMLALIAMDISDTCNVVIAPKNIIKQWEQSCSAIYGPKDDIEIEVPWTVADYSAISRLYLNSNAFINYRVILLEQSLIDTFALAWGGALALKHGPTNPIHRTIIDEIDNLSGLMTQPIMSEKVWLISTSFNPNDPQTMEGLPYNIDKDSIAKIICCTEPEFVQMTVKLEPPIIQMMVCDDSDIELFMDIMPKDIMTSLNAGSTRMLKKHIGYIGSVTSIYELAKWYENECEQRVNYLTTELSERKRKLVKGMDAIIHHAINADIQKLVATVDAYRTHRRLLQKRLSTYQPPQKSKHTVLENLIQKIKSQPFSKWLIFNDDANAIFDTESLFEHGGIKYAMLDGGNVEKVSKTIADFKSKAESSIQVLIVNSSSEGCGLNLENATHVLFMHATNQLLVEQIIGRAQRFGRTGPLTIVGMFNKGELQLIKNSSIPWRDAAIIN